MGLFQAVARSKVHYAWMVCALCGVQLGLSAPGQTYSVSQFVPSISDATGLSVVGGRGAHLGGT